MISSFLGDIVRHSIGNHPKSVPHHSVLAANERIKNIISLNNFLVLRHFVTEIKLVIQS